MSINNSQVYAEVYAVLSALGDEYLRQTPKQILNFIAENRDKNLVVKIDPDIPLEKQPLSTECTAMIAMLKLDYWCGSKEEKDELQALLNLNEEKHGTAPLSAESKTTWIKMLKNKKIKNKKTNS